MPQVRVLMRSKIYIALGHILGATLKKVLKPVIVADDNLLLGPSRVLMSAHHAARARYWGSIPSAKLDARLSRLSGAVLCIAVPPTLNGLLTLCRLCSVALEGKNEVHIMPLAPVNLASAGGIDPGRKAHLDSESIAHKLPPPVPWSGLETAMAATIWRLWCRASPVAFSQYCAAASALHPQLADLGRWHAGFFPRLQSGKLLLSRLDELILRQLSTGWSTPSRIYVNTLSSESVLAEWLSHTGDTYIAARLLAWSRHTPGLVVERRREKSTNGSEMLAWSFRWHPGGEAILDGLPSHNAAPLLAIGGAKAYDSCRPWVCRLDAASVPYVARMGRGVGALHAPSCSSEKPAGAAGGSPS
jgi:hypothetical protein